MAEGKMARGKWRGENGEGKMARGKWRGENGEGIFFWGILAEGILAKRGKWQGENGWGENGLGENGWGENGLGENGRGDFRKKGKMARGNWQRGNCRTFRKLSNIEHSQYWDGWPLQTGEPYKGLAGAAVSSLLYHIASWGNDPMFLTLLIPSYPQKTKTNNATWELHFLKVSFFKDKPRSNFTNTPRQLYFNIF
jgi:hypothetical protein